MEAICVLWIVCIIINHIILYIYWLADTEEGSTIKDMYAYYTEDNFMSLYLFIIFIWTPLNFIVILFTITFILTKVVSNIKIR